MTWDKLVCKLCGKQFDNPEHLHDHIKSTHNIKLVDYYKTFWPRKNILTGDLISFKTFESYFDQFFDNKPQLEKWFQKASQDERKRVLKEMLETRVKRKKLRFAPQEVELITQKLPSKSYFIEAFGSYEDACETIGVMPILDDTYERIQVNTDELTILIDTREQKPLSFKNQREQKLAIGDYCLDGKEIYTYVDRKSPDDFKGTMTQGFERFKKEVERAKVLGCYIIVMIEQTPEEIKKQAVFQRHDQANPEFAFKNMRELIHLYPRNLQFVFTGNRKTSELVIPYILAHDKALWRYDIQYHLKKKGLVK